MKVLILHASAGAGHKRAADALAKGFGLVSPGTEIIVRDILDFTTAVFKRSYAQGYLNLVRSAPELWGYFYAQSDRKSQQPLRKKVRTVFNKLNTRSFAKFFRELAPDAVVCTHFMPLEIVSTMIAEGRATVPLFCVVTDFAVHSLWLTSGITRYYVATEEARRFLARHGRRDVKITGIPVDPGFAAREPVEAARTRFAPDPQLPAILLLSGGFGVGPTVELVESFRGADVKCQLLVVAGRNEDLKREIEEAAAALTIPVRVFGFVDNIHELMDAVELVISKPGGLTTAEALAKGKPMIVIDPIPGQEQRNSDFLLEAGAAIRLHEVGDAPFKIQMLLGDPGRLARMRECIANIARPHASQVIAADVLAAVAHPSPV
jgi:processive 1,2-diacylglycerol beta-glucosyltransferase